MATLYVRNVPADLPAKLRTWAAESGRSMSFIVIELLRQEAERRKQDALFKKRLEELNKYPPLVGPWEELIREDRDRGHKPEFGY